MYASAVQDLIDELGRLPGIGPKSAQRIAFHLLKLPPEDALRLAAAINTVKDRVTWCRRCFNIAETGAGRPGPGVGPVSSGTGSLSSERGPAGDGGVECGICADDRRDATIVCVVEEPRDLIAIERTREFRGRYHVLQGAISPIDGIGADKLRIRELLARIQNEGIEELILCTNPNIEGDATAMYLTNLLRDLPVKVTQLASGLPVGSDLEYADEITLGRALEGRRTLG
jgi:recombination protein RecR